MYNLISQQVRAAQQEVFQMQKIESKLTELKQQRKEIHSKVEELTEILKKEDMDVDKLEGKGLAHIFHSFLGNIEERLLKERQEALAARLKYDQAIADQELIEHEISHLEDEMLKYRGCNTRYTKLLEEKKEMLMSDNSLTGQKILDMNTRLNMLNNQMNEMNEAIDAGRRVLYYLKSAAKSLDSAEGWGTWDLIGGGLISDMVKHSHIDEAKDAVSEAQSAIIKFRSELADIHISAEININTDGFGKFADFVFDGLIADWCMQSKIHDSQASVQNVLDKTEIVLSKLEAMMQDIKLQNVEIRKEIDEIVTNA